MSNADFVNVVCKNVLGRKDGADAESLAYWSGKLADGSASRRSLVSTTLAQPTPTKATRPLGMWPTCWTTRLRLPGQ